jgi:hypothetical protein
MIKLTRCIGQDVKGERLDIKVDGLVVDEQLAKEREILCVKLRKREKRSEVRSIIIKTTKTNLLLQTIHFPNDVCTPLIHLSTGWMSLFAVLLVHRVATVGPHILETAITHP